MQGYLYYINIINKKNIPNLYQCLITKKTKNELTELKIKEIINIKNIQLFLKKLIYTPNIFYENVYLDKVFHYFKFKIDNNININTFLIKFVKYVENNEFLDTTNKIYKKQNVQELTLKNNLKKVIKISECTINKTKNIKIRC